MTVDEWIEKGREIDVYNKYTEKEIKMYLGWINSTKENL